MRSMKTPVVKGHKTLLEGKWISFPYFGNPNAKELEVGFLPTENTFFIRSEAVLPKRLKRDLLRVSGGDGYQYQVASISKIRRLLASLAKKEFRYSVLLPASLDDAGYRSIAPCLDLIVEHKTFLQLH